jgi:hypothetical protein
MSKHHSTIKLPRDTRQCKSLAAWSFQAAWRCRAGGVHHIGYAVLDRRVIVTNRSLPNDRVFILYNDRGTGGAVHRGRQARANGEAAFLKAVRLQIHIRTYNLANFLRTIARRLRPAQGDCLLVANIAQDRLIETGTRGWSSVRAMRRSRWPRLARHALSSKGRLSLVNAPRGSPAMTAVA